MGTSSLRMAFRGKAGKGREGQGWAGKGSEGQRSEEKGSKNQLETHRHVRLEKEGKRVIISPHPYYLSSYILSPPKGEAAVLEFLSELCSENLLISQDYLANFLHCLKKLFQHPLIKNGDPLTKN